MEVLAMELMEFVFGLLNKVLKAVASFIVCFQCNRSPNFSDFVTEIYFIMYSMSGALYLDEFALVFTINCALINKLFITLMPMFHDVHWNHRILHSFNWLWPLLSFNSYWVHVRWVFVRQTMVIFFFHISAEFPQNTELILRNMLPNHLQSGMRWVNESFIDSHRNTPSTWFVAGKSMPRIHFVSNEWWCSKVQITMWKHFHGEIFAQMNAAFILILWSWSNIWWPGRSERR